MTSRKSFSSSGRTPARTTTVIATDDREQKISNHHRNSNNNKSDSEDAPFVPLEETLLNGDHHHHHDSSSNALPLSENGDDPRKEVVVRRSKSSSQQQLPSSSAAVASSSTSSLAGARPPKAPESGTTAATLPTTATTSNSSALPFVKLFQKLDGKKVVSSCMFTLLFLLVCDSVFTAPERRILKPDFSQTFLKWVQKHPAQGLIWILIFMASAVVFMIPIGTPITVGCGYIYKGAYGWRAGVAIATVVSMAGSALGAVVCFLLGRYLMRHQVRKWIRKYPLFDAIDVASEQHGLRIMAMLYLTPILPLGPVSYMCGTTSMALHHFVMAKVAALPLMCLYVIIGASTGTLLHSKNDETLSAEQMEAIEENQALIVGGIVLSALSIACITHYIRKELNHILEKQKRQMHDDEGGGGGGGAGAGGDVVEEEAAAVELGKAGSAAPRQRKH